MPLEAEYQKKIIGILTVLFPTAKIYLYGSRARGTEHERSDIDLAIDEGQKIRTGRIGEVKGMFEESEIPYHIDIVDLHRIPQQMKDSILSEGILWKN